MGMPFNYKPLYKILIDRGMKKTDLRTVLGIGTNTIAKFDKGENVSMEVLDKLCTYFGVQPNDIIEHVPSDKS